jgi:hypothetical protein
MARPDCPEEEEVLEVYVVAPADVEPPCMDDRRVMISRNVGRIVGS